ncbi:uncharacterized protein MEPE_00397 [Melanopsichium pennsylvanicum]|uniref:Raffinose synthase n=2 Tax=Melanopsichium pennsylvanicum TaxID=63383 RepID=A0AAJ5C2N5_9BASI|nr:raffinose synthase protein [Melanopsichium pennsylvanicum 4]SNX81692.1 uncharacterized protein MEPE_00397 [Melanopsichium pennsylvanicum]
MRSAPLFQPELNSSWPIPQSQACDRGLKFAAHYPADDFSASLARGAARLELWTNLPVSQSDAASTSQATAWKAVPLRPVNATVGRNTGYSFVADFKCSVDTAVGTFGYTYRIVHPDGQTDWLGSPSNDGKIHLLSANDPSYTIRQLVQPHCGTNLEDRKLIGAVHECEDAITLATLAASRRDVSDKLSFNINAHHVVSGLLIERTKSTWCTSRRFRSLTAVSPDFGCNLLVLELAQSSSGEVLVIMPVFDDSSVQSRLIRGSCNGDDITFEMVGPGWAQAKISLALGTIGELENVVSACRSHAARILRAPIHEPLGLGWSAKKSADFNTALSPDIDVSAPSLPHTYDEPECVDISFYSDSTAIDSGVAGMSRASSMVLASDEEPSAVDEQDDGSTVDGDRTEQAGNRSSPSQTKPGLGFCTWEAMQNEKRRPFLSQVVVALHAAEERLGTGSISALLIDDGWQDVEFDSEHRGRLNSFDMNPEMLDFLQASDAESSSSVLTRYVSHIRQEFPAIKSVGCWMTLAGYWDGIHPDGPVADSLSAPLRQVRVVDPFRQANRDWFIQATELDMHLFWDMAFHSLRQSGIDFVKIDAQAEWEWIQDVTYGQGPSPQAGSLGKAAFEAMEGAAARYFGAEGGVIHSMAFTSALTNTSRTLHSPGMTIRITDDFFPEIPEAHRHHLAHNVYNSLLLREHLCDADMLSHCVGEALSSEANLDVLDFTGYHASFRAFTDAQLWISDKAGAPKHDSVCALVPLPALTGQGAAVSVQARGCLLPTDIFADLTGVGSGTALKLRVHHEQTGAATLGLWNLRGGQAQTFDVLDIRQILERRSNIVSVHGALHEYYAVKSFRSGSICLLATAANENEPLSNMLGATLEAGLWEVLTISPLLTTTVKGVSAALLGSIEHFMTQGGVQSVSISLSYPEEEGRRNRLAHKSRRPPHHRQRSTRSTSTYSDGSIANSTGEKTSKTALTSTTLDNFAQQSFSGSSTVLVSLALVDGFFAILHGAVTGMSHASRSAQEASEGKRAARVDLVNTIIGVLDKLQTLIVFVLLVLASWTSALPNAVPKNGSKASWLEFFPMKRVQGDDSDRIRMDDKELENVRLRPADAVETLRRCLASRTTVPLQECPISISNDKLVGTPPNSVPQSPVSKIPAITTKPDVVLSCRIDVAAKISFLVICPSAESIQSCSIERRKYECGKTP